MSHSTVENIYLNVPNYMYGEQVAKALDDIAKAKPGTIVAIPNVHVLKDVVNSPEHYNIGKVECIDAIKASMSKEEFLGYLKGSALKYQWRYKYKGKPIEDLKKAEWYLTRLIQELQNDSQTASK